MKTSRFLLTLGLLGLAYAPAVSAKFIEDIVPSMQPTSGSSIAIPPSATGGSITPNNPTGTSAPAVLPQGAITRAAFTQMIVEKLYSASEIKDCYWDIATSLPPTFSLLYTDVPASSPYGHALCIALRDGIARGYGDGSFHPNDVIRFSEAAKIVSRAYVLAPYADAERTVWYMPHAFALAARNVVPISVTTFQHVMTVSETEEMLKRLDGSITWEPTRSFEDILRASQPRPAAASTSSTSSAPITPMTDSALKPKESSASSEPTKKEEEKDAPWYKIF